MVEVVHTTPHPRFWEVYDTLIALLEQGERILDACAKAGVDPDTFLSWMRKGGVGRQSRNVCPPHMQHEPYYTFAQKIQAAKEKGKLVRRPRWVTPLRPRDFTPAERELILDLFRQGHSYKAVAYKAKIHKDTLRGWLWRGGYPHDIDRTPIEPEFIIEPYRTFVEDVLRAEDEFFTGQA